jgi:hypothetical protein
MARGRAAAMMRIVALNGVWNRRETALVGWNWIDGMMVVWIRVFELLA